MIVIIVAVLLLAGLGGGAYFADQRRKASVKAARETTRAAVRAARADARAEEGQQIAALQQRVAQLSSQVTSDRPGLEGAGACAKGEPAASRERNDKKHGTACGEDVRSCSQLSVSSRATSLVPSLSLNSVSEVRSRAPASDP